MEPFHLVIRAADGSQIYDVYLSWTQLEALKAQIREFEKQVTNGHKANR